MEEKNLEEVMNIKENDAPNFISQELETAIQRLIYQLRELGPISSPT